MLLVLAKSVIHNYYKIIKISFNLKKINYCDFNILEFYTKKFF